jgi:hypothetical protein
MISELRCAIGAVKQYWAVIGWVTKNLLSQAPQCFGRHVKPLESTNPHWARVVGYGPYSLCVFHEKVLCPSSGHINRLMRMIYYYDEIRQNISCGVRDKIKE